MQLNIICERCGAELKTRIGTPEHSKHGLYVAPCLCVVDSLLCCSTKDSDGFWRFLNEYEILGGERLCDAEKDIANSAWDRAIDFCIAKRHKRDSEMFSLDDSPKNEDSTNV